MPGGRPTKMTPVAKQAILDALAAGNMRHDAAEHAGVGASTLKRWLALGRRQERGPWRDFLVAVKKAEADAVAASVGRIRRAAIGGQLLKHVTRTSRDGTVTEEKIYAPAQWTADAWFLERKRGADWGSGRELLKTIWKELAELKRSRANEESDHARGGTEGAKGHSQAKKKSSGSKA
jgi:hypothetical protein